jgi:hypothetical protein
MVVAPWGVSFSGPGTQSAGVAASCGCIAALACVGGSVVALAMRGGKVEVEVVLGMGAWCVAVGDMWGARAASAGALVGALR